ncbi:FAD-dependent oxidoreductase [Exiguobacterium qingdaonense]|uniref:FAD-dependent oxidoreductase n=1 Tax=Exiguobacterium qingdaonense TaxID=2751251 RepID=UPI001BEB298C|nr:FAD-dependent oxidoreductase [Exiguobacterium qingdaonense]
MGFIQDISPIFKRHDIIFEEHHNEVGDIHTFIFRSDQRIDWKAGQHGAFTITHDKIKKPTRAFSIASTAEDGYIEISTRVGENPSEFKQALLNLERGMTMSMRGPFGGFYIHDKKPTVLIAGGIGITPFKSIVRHVFHGNGMAPEKLHLLYMDQREEFLYKDEFDNMTDDNPFTVEYVTEREDLHVSVEKYVQTYHNEGNYFVVGSPAMTKSIATRLKDKGIRKKNIIKDTFIGY